MQQSPQDNPITKQQESIIHLLSRFRFLTRIQIQHFLGHTNPTRINAWLRDLTQKDYLTRIYSTSFAENTKPAIYYLNINGIRFLKETSEYPANHFKKLYREGERSDAFIEHTLLLADIVLKLPGQNHHGHNEENLLYVAFTAPDLTLSPLDSLSVLKPDLVVYKKLKQEQRYHLLYLLEETLPPRALRKLILDINAFYQQGEWDERMDSHFPTILLTCSDTRSLITAKRLTKKLYGEELLAHDVPVLFGKRSDVKEHGITGEIWEVLN